MPDNQPHAEAMEDRIDSSIFRWIADGTYDWESWHAPDGRPLWVNAAVERMTGYSPAECLAMDDYPLALVAGHDRGKIADVYRDARAGGSGNDVEFQIAHRDGSELWGAVSWQPIYDDARRHLGYRASIRDVTDRQHLREELRLYNRHLEQLVQERTAKIAQLEEHRLRIEKLAAMGQMAAGIAHEVNNPLAGIRNAFALLRSSVPADDGNYELLDLIDSEIERISSITHQMYQLYRPSRQSPVVFDLERALTSVVALLQPQTAAARVGIELQNCGCERSDDLEATEVLLREGELRQILLNIVRNAVEASPPGGKVTIEFATDADGVKITVADQGEGISHEHAARVFEPFFSTRTDSPRRGMGLGLSVSQSLAEAMGGGITIKRSTASGACMQVTLPRRIASHE